MESLYDRIATSEQFAAPPSENPVVVDQSAQAAFGMDWAARQAFRPAAPEPPKPMIPIVPVAS